MCLYKSVKECYKWNRIIISYSLSKWNKMSETGIRIIALQLVFNYFLHAPVKVLSFHWIDSCKVQSIPPLLHLLHLLHSSMLKCIQTHFDSLFCDEMALNHTFLWLLAIQSPLSKPYLIYTGHQASGGYHCSNTSAITGYFK